MSNVEYKGKSKARYLVMGGRESTEGDARKHSLHEDNSSILDNSGEKMKNCGGLLGYLGSMQAGLRSRSDPREKKFLYMILSERTRAQRSA